MRILTVVVCCAILICGFACTKSPTGPSIPFSHLTTEDVGAIDFVLHINVTPILRSSTPLRVSRDGQTIFTATAPIDTVVVDGGLLPKQTYTYQLMQEFNGNFVPADAPLVVTTLDTTSHNFTWQMDTLGVGNSSNLRDVAIISPTDVWAVGEIYTLDSTGHFIFPPYNAAHWNGSAWELLKIQTITYDGRIIVTPLTSIFAFSKSDIWISSDVGAVGRWNGLTWSSRWISERSGSIDKMWGSSDSNFYLVGSSGSLTHYDATRWQKLESGTTYDIQDIYGTRDSRSGKYKILAVASNIYTGEGPKVLEIDSGNVALLPDNGLPWSLHGLWSSSVYRNYIVGDGIFFKSYLNATTPWRALHFGLTTYYTNAVRGNASNDIVVVGAYGVTLHYNGSSWKNYQAETYINGSLFRVETQGNFVVAVGQVGNRAVVLRGYR
ncbi:MAG: hypothetical protein HYR76_01265 [Ignavibacteria bacterium]|nr:hypothetical protein [Ignavibacteria bacterium]